MPTSLKPGRAAQSLWAGLALLAAALLVTLCSEQQAAGWQDYLQRFYDRGRIIDRDNAKVSHSEGQGYGMLLAAAANDREHFDALWQWTQAVLQRSDGLFSWRYRPCPARDRRCVDDPNNASDGDLLIAWALLRGAQRWEDARYHREAQRIASSILQKLVIRDHGFTLLLPGEQGFREQRDNANHYRLNLSYWVFPALAALAAAYPEQTAWSELSRDGLRLLELARFGSAQLHPDWLGLGPEGVYLPEDETRYGYNACRIPLHLVWILGPSRAAPALAPYRDFWGGEGPPPAWVDLASGAVADYAWSPGMAAIAASAAPRTSDDAAALATLQTPLPPGEGYYSSSLLLLSALARAEMPQ